MLYYGGNGRPFALEVQLPSFSAFLLSRPDLLSGICHTINIGSKIGGTIGVGVVGIGGTGGVNIGWNPRGDVGVTRLEIVRITRYTFLYTYA